MRPVLVLAMLLSPLGVLGGASPNVHDVVEDNSELLEVSSGPADVATVEAKAAAATAIKSEPQTPPVGVAVAPKSAPEGSLDAPKGKFVPLLCYVNSAINDHIYTVNKNELGPKGKGDWKPCGVTAHVNAAAMPGYSKLYRYLNLATLDHQYFTESQVESRTIRPEGFEGYVSQKQLKGMVTLDVYQHDGTKDTLLVRQGVAAPKGYAKVRSLGWVLGKPLAGSGSGGKGGKKGGKKVKKSGKTQPKFWSTNPTDSRLQPVFRYWNPALRDHFYTMDYDLLGAGKNGWRYQGIQMYIYPTKISGTVPMYRYWNLRLGDHFYTTDFYDMGEGKDGYRFKGILGYVRSAPSKSTVPVYRYFNKEIGDHFYTTNTMSKARGHEAWTNEGIAAYVYPVPAPSKKGEANEYSLLVPLYRYWNKRYQDHFYTTIWKEVDVGTHGWQYQGVQALVYAKQEAGTVPLYRYWNIRTLDHFYTTNFKALGDAKKDANGWRYEGIECYVDVYKKSNTVALYRYFNNVSNDHFYTTKWLGRTHKGYTYEGVQAYVHVSPESDDAKSKVKAPTGMAPLYQYYNPTDKAHKYTTSYDDLGSQSSGFVMEGVVGFVWTAEEAGTEPLHRYYNSRVSDSYLTTDYTLLQGGKDGWVYEGVIGHVKTRHATSLASVHRFFNRKLNDHVFTTAASASASGYADQGTAFYVAPYTGRLALGGGSGNRRSGASRSIETKTLYQYYNPSTKDTYITTSFTVLGGSKGAHGWNFIGALGKCAAKDDGGMLRLRQYFSKARKDHRYTIRHIRGGDWKLEGTVCYLSPTKINGVKSLKVMNFENARTMDNAIATSDDGPNNGQRGYRYIETLGYIAA